MLFVTIDIEGHGAHAARPHLGIDTALVGAQIINAMQSVVSRNVDPIGVLYSGNRFSVGASFSGVSHQERVSKNAAAITN